MINPIEHYPLLIFLLCIAAIAASVDIKVHKIPNILTFPSMLCALSYYTAFYGWKGFAFSLGGLCTGIALLLLPYLMGGMGAGDAKLMGAVGACLGMDMTLSAFLFIAGVGCLYAFLVIVFQRRRLKGYFKQLWNTALVFMLTRKYVRVETADEDRPKVYYGIAIAVGTLMFLVVEITGGQLAV